MQAMAGGVRGRWVALFTILLLATTAVPVLADPVPSVPSEGDFAWATEAEEERLPAADDIAQGLRELEQAEAAQERWRESPEAERFRDQSQVAFGAVSASEAEALLAESFAPQLELIDEDPARALSDAALKQVLGPTSARITAGGETMLMEGSAPVRARNEEGELEKVDLDLEAGSGGFTAANPLVDVRLPEQASGEIEVGASGFSVSPVLAGAESAARRREGTDLFYFEAAEDLDLLTQPISNGVELSAQLRSPESPEELRLAVELPAGASLAADGNGGAEVTREGERLASISAPRAFDALGAEVPSAMRIEGKEVVIEIPHRGGEFAYPILLDPAIGEDWYATGKHWYGGDNLWALDTPGIWVWQTNNGGRFWAGTSTVAHDFGGSGRGLHVSATSTSSNQPAEKFGQWTYTVSDPEDTTWIASAGASPFERYNYSCTVSQHPQPHDYAGIWSLQWSPQYGWVTFAKDDAHWSGHTYHTPPKDWKEKTGEVFILGMGTGSGAAKIPCWRDLYAGGVYIWLDDTENPSIGSPSGIPSGWFSDETQFSIDVPVSDGGLGIQNSTLSPQETTIIKDIAPQDQCSGLKADPCPNSMTAHFGSLDGDYFDEGRTITKLSTHDAVGKVSSTVQWETLVDRTPPEVTLSGQLAQATNEGGSEEHPPGEGDELSLPVYNLKIEATDGSNASDAAKRSGVQDIEVYLDGAANEESVPWEAQSCPAGSCPMSVTYQLKLNDLEVGEHTLEVIAVDHVGKERKREIEFTYIPATGMKDDYVMHYFPLPDGTGNEEEEEFPQRPELAVNVVNGNLVYREQDIEVEGPAVDLEVERYYNSLLPETENTEWGDGWTLAQTPDLEPEDTGGSPEPDEAALLDASGAIEEAVELPSEVGQASFDAELGATLTKVADGYELAEEGGEAATAIAFDEDGRTEQLLGGGMARVDYAYEGGELTEIAVDDPAKTSLSAEEVEEAEEGGEGPGEPTQLTEHQRSFGSQGSGDGQLNAPADVALDAEGNVWVADRANHRIQKFSPEGEYLTQFGAEGSGDGQLNLPSGLAIDSEGDIWVADRGNSRIQQFDPSGEFLSKFGISGLEDGALYNPEAISIDEVGDIWVTDGLINRRVQKFSPQGEFVERISSNGSAPGQIGNPKAIDVADGEVWIADWQNHRVSVFDEEGEFLFQFGSQGTGEGQFKRPAAIDVDAQGSVWVGDRENNRVQRFDLEGDYVAQFGSPGSGDGQFSLGSPMGIAAEGGRAWIADVGNHRIQDWSSFGYTPGPEVPMPQDDPKVEIETDDDLVSSVDGEEAGEHVYEHEGELLSAYEGPQGETDYDYDSEGRLTGVELPNGTSATIVYDATYGWVKSVTVAPEGKDAKTTYFEYSLEPRRTTVTPPDLPVTTYDVGADGSVLKWWNSASPPDFDDLAGTLWAERETQTPIPPGDHNLVVQAHSEEGVASIEIIADGNQLISEQTCEQDPEEPGIECVTLLDEWVTNTDMHPPGNLDLEVLITDRLGNSASERFWVNIPEPPPPPPPGALVPPTFHDILEFREEYGLEVVFPVANELELNNRIFNLIGAWHNPHTPTGAVARASWERWGVPLRLADVQELDYRNWYLTHDGPRISTWGKSELPDAYSGYYMDHPAGGKIRVGFTSNEVERLDDLKTEAGLVASSRLSGFPAPPQNSLASLNDLKAQVISAASSYTAGLINQVSIDLSTSSVHVGSPSPAQAASQLTTDFGSQAPITISSSFGLDRLEGRERISGPMLAGDRIVIKEEEEIGGEVFAFGAECTANYGAFERGTKPSTDQPVWRFFTLTSAHCAPEEDPLANAPAIRRSVPEPGPKQRRKFGTLRRTGWKLTLADDLDALAIRLEGSAGIVLPRRIYPQAHFKKVLPIPVKGTGIVRPGMRVCYSGATTDEKEPSGVKCGPVFPTDGPEYIELDGKQEFQWCFERGVRPGDSGAPIWIEGTTTAVGILSLGEPGKTCFVPLERDSEYPYVLSVFSDSRLAPINLATAP